MWATGANHQLINLLSTLFSRGKVCTYQAQYICTHSRLPNRNVVQNKRLLCFLSFLFRQKLHSISRRQSIEVKNKLEGVSKNAKCITTNKCACTSYLAAQSSKYVFPFQYTKFQTVLLVFIKKSQFKGSIETYKTFLPSASIFE